MAPPAQNPAASGPASPSPASPNAASPNLDGLFAPRSVAVYGASTKDPTKLGNSLLRNALSSDLDAVLVVSPRAGEAEGIPTSPSLGEHVDLALISVPAPAVEGAVADAAAAGARNAVILASGFGETGPEGKAVEDRIRRTAAAAGMRVLGPNCMGVISHLGHGDWLNGSYFWNVDLKPGGISLLSQSGAFGGMFLREASMRNLGISRFASLGNAADIDETEVLKWLAYDSETTSIGLFAEALSGGREFVDVVRQITRERPVVVLKSGKTAAGARAAVSHTGSIAGSHGAVSAALRRAGAIEAQTSDEFFDLLAIADAPLRTPQGTRLAVITISGGPSVLAADEAERLGFDLPELADATTERIRAVVPGFAATGNPVDLTPQCPPSAFGPAVAAVFEDENIDGVIAINCGLDVDPFGEAVCASMARTGKPTVAFVTDAPGVMGRFRDAGIPLIPSPERAVRSYTALCELPASRK